MSDAMSSPTEADRLTDPNPSEVGALRLETPQTEATETAATDTGEDTKEEAKARAGEVKETAQQERQRVQEEAKRQARGLVDQATDQLREQAEAQTSRFAGFLSSLSDQAHALTEGRMDDAGQLGQYAQQLGDETGRLAREVEQRGFQGLIDDVQRFARRRPASFLLGAAAAGVAVGRLGRGAKDAGPDSSSRSNEQLPAQTSGSTADPATGNVIAPEPGRVRTESGRLRG